MSTQLGPTEWLTYDVSADSLAGVADAISHLPEAGSCEWIPRWDASWGDDGLVASATVDVDTRITLPIWTDEASADEGQRHEWQRFLGALRDHEEGHCALVHRHLGGLDERLIGHSYDDAGRIFQAELDALQVASNDYDSATDHGRNAGTIIAIGP